MMFISRINLQQMGQENDKIEFQGHRTVNKRRQIFNREKQAKPVEVCEVPGCNCRLPHAEFNTKVCSSCLDNPPPFLKTRYQPKYQEQPISNYQPTHRTHQSRATLYQHQQAESVPSRIGYYNAWSLPTHKYYIRQRDASTPIRKQSVSSQYVEDLQERRDNVDSFLQQVEEKISRAVDAPKVQYSRRKQNMNLED